MLKSLLKSLVPAKVPVKIPVKVPVKVPVKILSPSHMNTTHEKPHGKHRESDEAPGFENGRALHFAFRPDKRAQHRHKLRPNPSARGAADQPVARHLQRANQ